MASHPDTNQSYSNGNFSFELISTSHDVYITFSAASQNCFVISPIQNIFWLPSPPYSSRVSWLWFILNLLPRLISFKLVRTVRCLISTELLYQALDQGSPTSGLRPNTRLWPVQNQAVEVALDHVCSSTCTEPSHLPLPPVRKVGKVVERCLRPCLWDWFNTSVMKVTKWASHADAMLVKGYSKRS